MSNPGFTAERSLGQESHVYRGQIAAMRSRGKSILPQQITSGGVLRDILRYPSPGWGACSLCWFYCEFSSLDADQCEQVCGHFC